ncbi:MAG: hypothetical protein JSR82_09115 [Verrucomicrobia bacterium]|nr:hypothetical protein [Verrucomicrobiota bacterium]
MLTIVQYFSIAVSVVTAISAVMAWICREAIQNYFLQRIADRRASHENSLAKQKELHEIALSKLKEDHEKAMLALNLRGKVAEAILEQRLLALQKVAAKVTEMAVPVIKLKSLSTRFSDGLDWEQRFADASDAFIAAMYSLMNTVNESSPYLSPNLRQRISTFRECAVAAQKLFLERSQSAEIADSVLDTALRKVAEAEGNFALELQSQLIETVDYIPGLLSGKPGRSLTEAIVPVQAQANLPN